MEASYALPVLCLAAYILGSIPFGFVIAKVFCGRDVRLEGSKNVGATNVARLCGLPYGITTLVCDALKGLVPVWLALQQADFAPPQAAAVGLCALIGHMYSVFLRFRGGKAVATTIGVFIPLSFTSLAISVAICVAVIAATRLVSLGSLSLALALPISLAALGRFDILPMACLVTVIIFFKHRENIKRLLRREEKRLGHRD